MKSLILTLSVLICLSFSLSLEAGKIKAEFLDKLTFSKTTQDNEKPKSIWNFTVCDEGIVIAPCYKTSKIYFYEQVNGELEWVKSIELNPGGPNAKPTRCYFSKEKQKLLIYDHAWYDLAKKERRIIVFNKQSKYEYTRDRNEIPIKYSLYDFMLKGEKIYVAGYESDEGKDYSFFSLGLDKSGIESHYKKNFLLSSYDFYHIEPEYGFTFKQKFGEKYVQAIGVRGYFDMKEDEVYCVWKGDLRVLKFNTSGFSKHSSRAFSKKTARYTRAFPTEELIDAYYRDDSKVMKKARKKMSLVLDVFIDAGRVLVVHQGPFNQGEGLSKIWLQAYTLDGMFLGEVNLPGAAEKLYYNSENQNLYSFSRYSEHQDYYLLKYKISGDK